MKDETVWLNAEQMAKLFGRDSKTIRKHINNALIEELDNSTVAKFAIVQNEGNRSVVRQIEYYNLDMIISVGYRVKSSNGIIFRKWANNVLKDYLLRGYAVNEKRLEYFEKTVRLISKDNYVITYDDCKKVINDLKYNNDSNLFALERNEGLREILGAIYQSFDGKDLYSTVEEKVANLLYMVVKNHVFIDGNKRIAATLFIYALQKYNILIVDDKRIIDNNTLVAMTLLIAESNPKKKEIIIDLVLNFLNK